MAETKSTENRVDDWVRTKLDNAKVNAYEKHDLPETLTAVFKGGSKTGNKGGGIPDFTVFFERYGTLVVIENKYFLNKHIKLRGEKIDTSAKAVKDYAVNGAVHYARHAINHDDIQDVIAIGISGESTESSGSSRLADNEVNITAYYVFDPDHEPTEIQVNKNFADFTLRNFPDFYQKLSISDADREQILKKNQADLKKSASELNNGNCLTYSDTTTSDAIFYQPLPYVGRSHVQHMEPRGKGFNQYIGLYVIESIKKAAGELYSYGFKFNRDRMNDTPITLPATQDGNPDWDYMEEYMNHILKTQRESEELHHRKEETILRKLVSLREN